MKNFSKKTFDSVKLMRKIRTDMAKRYHADPTLEDKELQEIKKKYKLTSGKKSKINSAE